MIETMYIVCHLQSSLSRQSQVPALSGNFLCWNKNGMRHYIHNERQRLIMIKHLHLGGSRWNSYSHWCVKIAERIFTAKLLTHALPMLNSQSATGVITGSVSTSAIIPTKVWLLRMKLPPDIGITNELCPRTYFIYTK